MHPTKGGMGEGEREGSSNESVRKRKGYVIRRKELNIGEGRSRKKE